MKTILSLLLLVFAALAVASIDSKTTETIGSHCAHVSGIDHNVSMDTHTHADCTQGSAAIGEIGDSSEITTPLVTLIPSMIDTTYVSITSKVTLPPPTI
ncbi:MAG: hypothetical protein ISR70_02870 [Candidatus Thioglobus sp.]|nr:hypothetical protein [Candidatus Thioglobus pontius]MBL6976986.1 hypothetical protein [Candidatus Thioglobus sp.]MBL6984762.1 hypothetical protein [Candidatus Thioglobus sp.]